VFTLGLAVLALAAFLVGVIADSRSFRNAVFLGLALALGTLGLADRLADTPGRQGHLLLLGLVVVVTLGPLLVACYLVENGVTMARRESLRPANLLPLVAGAGILAVIVLGTGLGTRGQVTPPLAGRLERGRAVWAALAARGGRPTMIVSGGQGSDERVPEAEAMAAYLIERGFPADHLLREDRSSTTEENLAFSKAIIDAARPAHPDKRGPRCVIVTSNYHVFRTAIIARKTRIRGQVTGARTAGYYWPSAMLREFAAVFLLYRFVNLGICSALVLAPVAYAVAGRV
jgi:uncharacterized SAM-binding protein YcdF (DUF218 family)